jgi:hypothetical protein
MIVTPRVERNACPLQARIGRLLAHPETVLQDGVFAGLFAFDKAKKFNH